MAASELEQTIKRAQQGDREAIGELYHAYAQTMYRFIYYRVSSEADAEDLVAEVFVKMIEGLPKYQITGAPFESWLYRIADARVIDFRRRQKRRPQTELYDELPAGDRSPEEQVRQREEVETLREALQHLPEEQQTILLLRFVENRSHAEVAELLGRTVSAIRSAQYRALIQLAALLGSEEKVRHYLRGSGGQDG